jgi:GNAT superfamily N-acetyltransferase
MDVELSTQIEPSDVSTYLELVHAASLPYDEFVYDDEAQARRVQRLLFEAGAGDWAPPQGRGAIREGRLVGVLAGVHARDLQRVRMNASLVLGRAGVLEDKELAARLRLAAQTLAPVQENDWFSSVIGVTPSERGTGVGDAIVELSRKRARDAGAQRIVGQYQADQPRLGAYYQRFGYRLTSNGKASDPRTGRTLHYQHIAVEL